MSMPAAASTHAATKAAIERNIEVGDWVVDTLPNTNTYIPVGEDPTADDVLKLVGDHPLPKKP